MSLKKQKPGSGLIATLDAIYKEQAEALDLLKSEGSGSFELVAAIREAQDAILAEIEKLRKKERGT